MKSDYMMSFANTLKYPIQNVILSKNNMRYVKAYEDFNGKIRSFNTELKKILNYDGKTYDNLEHIANDFKQVIDMFLKQIISYPIGKLILFIVI